MKKIKDYWADYKKPTPEKFRKLGDALLAVSVIAGPMSAMYNHELIGIGIVITAVAGKFLSTFFSK